MATFTPNPAGIAFVTRAREGPVGRDIERRTRRVLTIGRVTSPHRSYALRGAHSMAMDGARGSVTADRRYATWVHEGTTPHVIRPVRAKALRFRWGGQVVFARRVNHPGNRANPWLRNALRGAAG